MGSVHAAWWKAWYVGPVGVSLAGWIAVLATLDPQGASPGITCDELYHTVVAKRQVWAWEQYGLGFFSRPVVAEVFPFQPGGPPAHPPLIHWILGWVHRQVDPAPEDRQSFSIVGARLGAALGYGLLVVLVGVWTARQAGPLAGTAAALACALMPRVFAHGHLAALEIWTAFWLLAALMVAGWAETSTAARPEVRWLAAGASWGLALLSRMHAVLIGPVVFAWLLLRTKARCLLQGAFWQRMAIWTTAAGAVFFAGWPWLWYSPAEHLRLYLASATQRQPIHVYYLGRVWLDYEVPWHYPWVIFGATVPVGFLLLGLVGLWAGVRASPTEPPWGLWACLAGAGFMLFSWPGVPVYDGERLFLFVYPIWAIFVGLGCQRLQEMLLRWANQLRKQSGSAALAGRAFLALPHRQPSGLPEAEEDSGRGGCGVFQFQRLIGGGLLALVALQGVGLVLYHPCQLSYYNLLVGGLAGADRLGLEVNYWADAVREPLLAEAAVRAPGQTVFFAPHLAPFQAPGIAISSPALAESGTELLGWDPALHKLLLPEKPPAQPPDTSAAKMLPQQKSMSRWIIVYHRKADLPVVESLLTQASVVAEYRVRGVWLARLMKLPDP